MKRKWWLFPAAAVLALLLSLCFYGVRVRLAPRWMVSRGLGSALTQLEQRFADSPTGLLTAALDPEGCQQACVQLETELEHLGVVRYDMEVQTQLNPSRVLAEGTVVTGGKALDLALYLDQDFAAVSSQGLVDGTFYGITYDTFSQEIRSRELLALLIGDRTIAQWETSVAELKSAMAFEFSMPELTFGDIRRALYGVLTLKPQVGTAEISLFGQNEKVHTVTFQAGGQELAAAAEPYREELPTVLWDLIEKLKNDPDSAVQAVFFLHEGKLVKLAGSLDMTGMRTQITGSLGASPATEPLTLELETMAGEDLDRVCLVIDNASGQDSYEETVQLTRTQNGIQKEFDFDYRWDLSSGDMKLTLLLDSRKADLRLNLRGEGERVTITTQDISPLINLFLEKPWEGPAICTLQLGPGTAIGVPEYRNLDQWSMEDLFALLTGLGGLLGLQLP